MVASGIAARPSGRPQGRKKRRKKGDKSKNGKEVIVVVMYTLKRGEDGKLHGPRNKKIYATFAGSKAAAAWARAEATKRGFGADTTKTVQIVMDGAKRLQNRPGAAVSQGDFYLGRVARGGKAMGGGPSLSQGRQ